MSPLGRYTVMPGFMTFANCPLVGASCTVGFRLFRRSCKQDITPITDGSAGGRGKLASQDARQNQRSLDIGLCLTDSVGDVGSAIVQTPPKTFPIRPIGPAPLSASNLSEALVKSFGGTTIVPSVKASSKSFQEQQRHFAKHSVEWPADELRYPDRPCGAFCPSQHLASHVRLKISVETNLQKICTAVCSPNEIGFHDVVVKCDVFYGDPGDEEHMSTFFAHCASANAKAIRYVSLRPQTLDSG